MPLSHITVFTCSALPRKDNDPIRFLTFLSRKAEDTYPTGASGPCSHFMVKSKLLIYFCSFVCIILVTACSL